MTIKVQIKNDEGDNSKSMSVQQYTVEGDVDVPHGDAQVLAPGKELTVHLHDENSFRLSEVRNED